MEQTFIINGNVIKTLDVVINNFITTYNIIEFKSSEPWAKNQYYVLTTYVNKNENNSKRCLLSYMEYETKRKAINFLDTIEKQEKENGNKTVLTDFEHKK